MVLSLTRLFVLYPLYALTGSAVPGWTLAAHTGNIPDVLHNLGSCKCRDLNFQHLTHSHKLADCLKVPTAQFSEVCGRQQKLKFAAVHPL